MLNISAVSVTPLKSSDVLTDFKCENVECSDFLRNPQGALEFQRKNLGVTYVFRSAGTVIGFITVTMSAFRKHSTGQADEDEQAIDVPCLLLPYMARDIRYKAQGAGKIMSEWTISLASQLSNSIGCRFVIIEIKQEMITLFQQYGFELLPPDSNNRHYVMFFDLGMKASEQ